MRRRFRLAASAAAALLLLAIPARAAAQVLGFQGYADVGFTSSSTTNTDATGRTTRINGISWPQNYRLSYDNVLYPYLAFSAAGYYTWNPGTATVDGLTTETSPNQWNVYARLTVGPPVLNAMPYYSRRQEFATSTVAGITSRTPTLVRETFGVFTGWNPDQLPVLSLKLSRSLDYDLERAGLDRATNELLFTAAYFEVKNLRLQYAFRAADAEDRVRQVDFKEYLQSIQVGWSGGFFEGRLITSINYNLGWRYSEVVATGSAGTVSTQRFPLHGLSLVEVFPATPARDTLVINDALINGELASSAGIDIGYAPSLAGDVNFRDVGAELADSLSPVNQIQVWVDRPLAAAVWSTFVWSAYQSNDNVDWTPVPITAPVVFGTFDNRFEISIAQTQARFYKVVVKPLSPAVTSDPQYAAIFVTEVQLYQVVPVSQAPVSSTQVSGILSASARVLILRSPVLSYDFTGSIAHEDVFNIRSWSVTNGFSYTQRLSPVWGLSARVERTDAGQEGRPHEASNRWSASLSADPIPTLGAMLVYSGLYSQLAVGSLISNGVTLNGRADLYEGVSLAGNVGYTLGELLTTGRQNGATSVGVAVTVTPHKTISLNGSYNLTNAFLQGGGLPDRKDVSSSLQGSATFSPIAAFFFSAGATRFVGVGSQGSSTLANLSVGLSPFPGGALVVRFGYNEAIDVLSETRTRIYGPSLRWNIRPGAIFDVAYTWTDTVGPALTTLSEAFIAKLTVYLR